MVRGYLTSTIGRSVKPDRLNSIRLRIEDRGSRTLNSGFLSLSSDVLDVPGWTRGGSGEIKYKLHSRNHRRPFYSGLRLLRGVVEKYVAQMEIEDFEQPARVLSLTASISFNGAAWAAGSGCMFYLDDDARSQARPRVGQVVRFLAVEVDGGEEFFVEITEHTVLRWQRSIAIVDFSRRSSTRITHSGHVVALAVYAPYWQPQFTQYKCVTRVTDTY
jgi:hypothetical protein